MLNQPSKLTFILRIASLGLLIGVMVWLILLAATASSMRASHYKHSEVKFGPLGLNAISRTESRGSATINLTFKAGLLAYFTGWAFIGSVVGAIQTQRLLKTE